VELVGIEPATS